MQTQSAMVKICYFAETENNTIIKSSKEMTNSYLKRTFYFLAIGILIYSCQNRQQVEAEQRFDLMEEKLPHSISFSDTQDSIQLLPDDLASQIIRYLKRHEGTKMKIPTSIPESWAVEYKLPAMSADFDIWIVSNTGDPTHKMLATVSSSQPFSIIEAVPVAYSAGIEKPNYIESEQWDALVKEDYSIIVKKSYEKIYSMTDTANCHASTSSQTEDIYIIENNGKIHYEAPAIYDIDYRAIVQFADTASMGNILGEDWLWNSIEIQEAAEPVGILYATVTKNFSKISIYNYHGDEVDIVDISSYLEKHNMGYLILQKGEKSIFAPYSSAKEFLPKAFKHFELEYEERKEDAEESIES